MKLVVLEGPASRPFYEVFQDRTLIGRAPECDILVFDAQVSRHHAQILKLGEAYVLESLQQANPAIVNDRVMLTRRRLIDGDLIILGTIVLEVDIPPPTVQEDVLAEPDVPDSAVVPLSPSQEVRAVRPTAQVEPANEVTDRATIPTASAPSPIQPAATPQPAPDRRASHIDDRRTPRPPTLPPMTPREQLRTMAARLGSAGQRLQTRLAMPANLPSASPADQQAVAQIVADHERLGGDAELARLAALLSERLTNQTDIRALYRLGAEATVLVAWSRLAQRSMEEAVHLAEVLSVH